MPNVTHVFLVRHGQTEWNVIQKVMGKTPIPLNELGRAQASVAGEVLKEVSVDALFHSPYLRTTETAARIAHFHPNLALEPHVALAEVNYGDWEGKSFEELRGHEAFAQYFSDPALARIPGGETMAEVQTRVVSLIEHCREQYVGQNVVLVSHSDVIKVALTHYLSLPLSAIHRLCINNGSISLLRLSGAFDRVVCVNRTVETADLFHRAY